MTQEKTINDILEIVTFIKDTAASKVDLERLEKRVTKIEALMVTKDYLDEKLGRLKGDLVVEMRGFNHKLSALVEILRDRKVISPNDARQILSMEPFPQLSI